MIIIINDNNKNHYCFSSFHRISYDNFHELYEIMASHKRGFHEGRFHNPETTALFSLFVVHFFCATWFLGVASVWILKNSTRLHWNLKLTILDLSVHGPKKLRNVLVTFRKHRIEATFGNFRVRSFAQAKKTAFSATSGKCGRRWRDHNPPSSESSESSRSLDC